MSIFNDRCNVCDRCGTVFVVGTGASGTVDGATFDFCEDCTKELDVTTCGDCGDLMEWGSLNNDYQCCVCERKAQEVA